MESNKFAAYICVITTILSFFASIFVYCPWLQNVFLAIFGSSLLASVISVVNYLTMRVDLIEEIVFDLFKINNMCTSSLYALPRETCPEDFHPLLGLSLDLVNSATVKVEQYRRGLLFYEKAKRADLSTVLTELEDHFIRPLTDTGFFLEKYHDIASQYMQETYAKLYAIFENQDAYLLVLKVASKSGSRVWAITKDVESAKAIAAERILEEFKKRRDE